MYHTDSCESLKCIYFITQYTDYTKFDSLSFESHMESRANTLLMSLSTMTLSENIEQLSEAECQARIKHHQEKAQRLLAAAQRVCG